MPSLLASINGFIDIMTIAHPSTTIFYCINFFILFDCFTHLMVRWNTCWQCIMWLCLWSWIINLMLPKCVVSNISQCGWFSFPIRNVFLENLSNNDTNTARITVWHGTYACVGVLEILIHTAKWMFDWNSTNWVSDLKFIKNPTD